jgi:hypothetical protein
MHYWKLGVAYLEFLAIYMNSLYASPSLQLESDQTQMYMDLGLVFIFKTPNVLSRFNALLHTLRVGSPHPYWGCRGN